MTRAHEFTVKTKLDAWSASKEAYGKPRCAICLRIILGLAEFDHKTPVGLGGKSTLDNCQVVCAKCHKLKTHGEDRPVMAKADRQKKSGAGVKRKHKWPRRKFGQ